MFPVLREQLSNRAYLLFSFVSSRVRSPPPPTSALYILTLLDVVKKDNLFSLYELKSLLSDADVCTKKYADGQKRLILPLVHKHTHTPSVMPSDNRQQAYVLTESQNLNGLDPLK